MRMAQSLRQTSAGRDTIEPGDASAEWFDRSMADWLREPRLDVRVDLMVQHLERCQHSLDELSRQIDWL